MQRMSTLLATLLAVATTIVIAEWSQDPTARTTVCNAENTQGLPLLARVEGGFMLAWRDQRRGSCGYNCIYTDIYAQKVSVEGDMLWQDNGRVIAAGPSGVLSYPSQLSTGLVDDGAGGALIAWNDQSGVYLQGYVTKVSTDAEVAWGLPGEPIQPPDSAVSMLDDSGFSDQWGFAADSEGGIFAPVGTWIGRFDTDGRLRTTWFDDPSDNQNGSMPLALVPVTESGGKDGVIVVWIQGNGYFVDSILAHKLVDPETLWPTAPDNFDDVWGQKPLYDPEVTISAWRLVAIPDGAGGVIAAWIDNRTGNFRVYAQRVDADGNLPWGPAGIAVSDDIVNGSYWSVNLAIAADGEGGGVIAWNDPYHPELHSVKAQRLDADGQVQWQAGGVLVASDGLTVYSPYLAALIRATDGNFIALYHSAGCQQLIAQKLGVAQGDPLWPGGSLVHEGCFSTYYERARMVSDGQAGAIVAYAACDGDIYAHRIEEKRLPDLTVTQVMAPRMLRTDKPITVRITIGNQGDGDVSGNYRVSLFLDDELLKTQDIADAPTAGAETTVTLSGVQIQAPSPGNHSLVAQADTDNTIIESNEENNTASISVRTK